MKKTLNSYLTRIWQARYLYILLIPGMVFFIVSTSTDAGTYGLDALIKLIGGI